MDDFTIPRDESGNVLPHDHPNFATGKSLIRRISAEHVVFDKNRNCQRLSSALFAYDDPANHLSCDSPACIEACNEEPAAYVSTDGWLGAVVLAADKVRSIQAGIDTRIGMVPLEENPCHGGVWAKITRGRANAMLRTADWLVAIPNTAKSDQDAPLAE